MSFIGTFSVKELAEKLGASEETVRRWIRSGKLYATRESRKGGNSVSESDLSHFLKNYPKYARRITSSTLALSAVSSISGALAIRTALEAVSVLLSEAGSGKKEVGKKNLSPNDVIPHLMNEISSLKASVQSKKDTITKLEAEVLKDSQRISQLENLLLFLKESKNNKKGISILPHERSLPIDKKQ